MDIFTRNYINRIAVKCSAILSSIMTIVHRRGSSIINCGVDSLRCVKYGISGLLFPLLIRVLRISAEIENHDVTSKEKSC